VSTNDVIAEARINADHLLLNIARGLGLSDDNADQYLQCKAGTQVMEGDVLAGPLGITKRVVRAPRSGRVIVAGGGQVLLEIESAPYEVKAGLPGTVTNLVADRGAMIEAVGALIQGVWGNGRIEFGLMNVLLKNPDDALTPDNLDVSLRGSIVLGGYLSDAEALKNAAGLPLRGMILSSIEPALLPLAERMRYPIVVIEGFGPRPMNNAAFNLLTTNERREVAINAQHWSPLNGDRPEIIIPLPATVEPAAPPETETFVNGLQVRVIHDPLRGMTGLIVEVKPGIQPLPSGITATVAEVLLETGEKAILPLANLEVIA
jgi:hypothetical protein